MFYRHHKCPKCVMKFPDDASMRAHRKEAHGIGIDAGLFPSLTGEYRNLKYQPASGSEVSIKVSSDLSNTRIGTSAMRHLRPEFGFG